MGDYFSNNGGPLQKTLGINWIIASLFIVADMAGGGIVALPTATVRCSFWLGLVILGIMATMSTLSAIMLGKCWIILLRRFPTYRTHCRKPYSEIAYRAMGTKMQKIVSICILLTQFGSSTVFLLLSSKNIDDFLKSVYKIDIGYCYVIILVGVMLLPLTLLKSPQDFWQVVVGGMISTTIAVCFIIYGSMLDYKACSPTVEMPPLKTTNILIALGTFLFTYGGHAAFPTVQHDMRRPSDFKKTAILAFSIITIMNCFTVFSSGLTYGSSLTASVIDSIQTSWIQQAISLMITAHCLLTITLIINPLNQEIEDYFRIPHDFGIKRILVRTLMMGLAVFMAETVPKFDAVLELIGASMLTLTSLIFPGIFYLYLSTAEKKANEIEISKTKKSLNDTKNSDNLIINTFVSKTKGNDDDNVPRISVHEIIQLSNRSTLICAGIIVVLGSFAGIIATGSAINSIVNTQFTFPCYLQRWFSEDKTEDSTSNSTLTAIYNCCGSFKNISRHDNYGEYKFCKAPKFNFYVTRDIYLF